MRWREQRGIEITPDVYMGEYRSFHFENGAPLPDAARRYEGWLTDPGTLVVSYEALIHDDGEMRRIAAYLDVPYPEGAWARLPGETPTWNPVHSDRRSIWCPEIEDAFRAEGGYDLLARWRYKEA